jgi:hypothetical protein
MRLRGGLLMVLMSCWVNGAALAQVLDFAAIPPLTDKDSIAAAKLSPTEVKQILDQVEQTSFDTPDSWQAELRLRRLPIAGGDGIVVRGTALLCGGTGSCETWLFRRSNGVWANMFDGEAPVISSFGFGRHASHDVPDLIATAPLSAATSRYVVYVFDGAIYRVGACYKVDNEGLPSPPRRWRAASFRRGPGARAWYPASC